MAERLNVAAATARYPVGLADVRLAANKRRGESAAHAALKRAALIWAQAQGYSACALEVRLPRCRYRADVAAFAKGVDGERTAVFECKQSIADLRRDNCDSATAATRLAGVETRRETIERNLRVHYPGVRRGDALFPEYDAYDFARLNHSGHRLVVREMNALERRLRFCTKFETLVRYRCANQLFLVIARELDAPACAPPGWGVLVEERDTLCVRTPAPWHGNTSATRSEFLRRVAIAGTRAINRHIGVTVDEVSAWRKSMSVL